MMSFFSLSHEKLLVNVDGADSPTTRTPQSLRLEILQQMHNSKTSGHLGVAKTLGRIREILLGQVPTRGARVVLKF